MNLADVRFLLLPLPEFNMLPFGGFLDKLRFSADDADHSQQRHCSWQVVGLDYGHVVSSSGIPIEIPATPTDINVCQYDYLVIFGSRSARKAQLLAQDYGPFLKQAAAQGITLISIDNACFTLAELGLLNDHKITVHWRHINEFSHAYPRLAIANEQLYNIDNKRISCSGGSAAIDLAVAILSRHLGQTWAIKGLADMLIDESRSQLHQLKSRQQTQHHDRHLGRTIALMQELMASNTSIEKLAAITGLSRRQLDRHFKVYFKLSAHQYWSEMRLQHVHWRLVNSDHSLDSLADEVGFQDSSYLCKVFRKRFNVSPGQLRNQNQRPNAN
ncbi:helix-turn-helix domain-containing protein [Moritella marina ATCC 15381]|uniref:Helix-turn-helix domain-containing protein n=1 Tax=Moritella marina ATCC 15381 TaxID=1202962 RepID=A0A5J6WKH9_MORMI|nr:helix-turn-helix domain-containing protein [Moritella marina]QFI38676.1 helix-turn-helix domain-containing protein [Moritella marina ATCC 15381]